MSEAKFTPGPWFARQDDARRYPDQWIITIGEFSGCRGDEYLCVQGICKEADARLITASPVMHDALVSIAEYWNGDRNESAMNDALEYIVNLATETAAKARGQS